MAEAGADPHEKDLVEKRRNKEWIFLGVGNIGQEKTPDLSTETLFWYRAMEPVKYDVLETTNQFPREDSYGGIANNHKYIDYKKYLSNKSAANRVVEFDTTKVGLLSEYFKKNGINDAKPEDGAISYGLGEKGNKPKGEPLRLFNDLLKKGDITWRVVDKKVPIK